jgi:uncharacterized protein (TIGR03067 family)
MIRHVMDIARAAGKELGTAETSGAAPWNAQGVQQELEKFQGSWMLVYWLYNGKEPHAEGRIILSFVGQAFTIRIGEVVSERGEFERLDPEQSPKAFDYAPNEVEGKPFQLKFPGVYLLQDDVLILCVGYRGMRPKTFSAEAGSDNELVFYKRVRQ